MTTKPYDGGPAFPLPHDGAVSPATDIYGNDISSGMTLRDYFAAQVLPAVFQAATDDITFDVIARRAYSAADEMIAARKSEREEA